VDRSPNPKALGSRSGQHLRSTVPARKRQWDAAFILGTTALVVTDRHTIGVSRDNENISRNISDGTLYGTEAAAGAIFFTGLLTDNAHARETGFITAEALLNAYPVYIGMRADRQTRTPRPGRRARKIFSGSFHNHFVFLGPRHVRVNHGRGDRS
jgi:hypothetical protein